MYQFQESNHVCSYAASSHARYGGLSLVVSVLLLSILFSLFPCYSPQRGTSTGIVVASASLIKKGGTGSQVREIQEMLSTSGYKIIVDGKFGDATEAAVKSFQKQNGLTPDGVVGPKTKAALQKSVERQASTGLSSGPSSMVASGTVYVVKKNETLSEIAQKLGVKISRLMEINGIRNPNFIREGQKLRISEPPKGSIGGGSAGGSGSASAPNAKSSDKDGQNAQTSTSASGLRSIEVGRIYTPEQLTGILEALAPGAASLNLSRGIPVPGSRSDNSKDPKGERRVALTFNDGPFVETTRAILDILKQNGIPATFFVVGSTAAQHPDILRRMSSEGHALGNHSYSHRPLRDLDPNDLTNEIEKTNSIIQNVAGSSPRFFRPPHGDFSKTAIEAAASYGLATVAWSNVGFYDYPPPEDPNEFVRNLASSVADGHIIMLHDGLRSTVTLLPKLIKSFKDFGIQIVPLSDVLTISKESPLP